MKILQNIAFIRQIHNGCCPASVNIVLDYYEKGIRIDQKDYYEQLDDYSKRNSTPFFKSAESVFGKAFSIGDKFQFTSENTSTRMEWEGKVKGLIEEGIPVIISTVNENLYSYHITVIYGFENDLLYEMCPTDGPVTIKLSEKLKNFEKGGTDLLIIKQK